jgi:hypothetical protein
MAVRFSRAEVADITEQFLNGTGGDLDWDDFTSLRIEDPALNAIRLRCVGLYDDAARPGHYCGPEGFAEMRQMVEKLRAAN